MNIGLAIAGLICVLMAIGHTTIGLVWVLPSLNEESLPSTPLGRSSMTGGMVRVTWYVVTIFALGMGGLLITLAWDGAVDPRTLMLRWFAGMWFAAAAMAAWIVRRRPQNLLRLPVPLLWVVVAVLLLRASS